MNPNVRNMLEEIHIAFKRKFRDRETSWDNFIDFLAAENCAQLGQQLRHKFEWLFREKDLVRVILEAYDASLLRSDYHDHLGDMYLDNFRDKAYGQIASILLINKNIEDFQIASLYEKQGKSLSVLDPEAKTGRFLMHIHRTSPESHLFGIESDIRLLRIALTNMAIHDIPAYLLNANITKHATDSASSAGKYNWQFANKWYSCKDKLKPMANC